MNRAQHNTVTEMTDDQFRQHALEILQRELGADGFARFLRVYLSGNGNFTRDRRKWQKGITVPQIMEDIKKRREKTA